MSNDLLSLGILGVGFPGEDDLNRPLGVIQDFGQTGRVLQDEVSPLVGGKPSSEADGQCFGM